MKNLIFIIFAAFLLSLFLPASSFADQCPAGYKPDAVDLEGINTSVCSKDIPPPCDPAKGEEDFSFTGRNICVVSTISGPPAPAPPGQPTQGSTNSFDIKTIFQPANLFGDFGNLLSSIVSILISASFIITIFFIITGGIKIVTASGDMKKIQAAQGTITYAIIGLVVTVLAFVILQVVQYFFGANVGIL
ncbi:MAG: hypothetical protein Q7S45_02510 [Candidatus Curtissbacteria bacterium]|nr:hypothetical protein [Candidatus Curtissbacteria bacterium]